MWRDHRLVKDCEQEENARARIYDRAEVLLELHESGRERPAKQIVSLLHAENFRLNGVRETLKDAPARIRFFCEMRNEGVQSD